MPRKDDIKEHHGWFWDRYWQANRVASCFEGTAGYAGEIAAGWRHFFSDFEDGARLLDICTGNGAVPMIAAEVARDLGHRFEIHGVDRAAIDPERFVTSGSTGLSEIRFRGRTRIERLPFSDASFDGVSGQYALEYTNSEKSIPEIVRVLRPGGRFRLVLHAREGTTPQASRPAIDQARFLLEEVRIFKRARAAIRLVRHAEQTAAAPGSTAHRRAAEAHRDFEQGLAAVSQAVANTPDRDMLRHVEDVLRHTYQVRHAVPMQMCLDKIDEVRAEVAAHKSRLEALVAAARSEDDCRRLVARFEGLGCQNGAIAPVTESEPPRLIGWELTAQRA